MTWIHIIHAVYTTTAKIYIHLHSRLIYKLHPRPTAYHKLQASFNCTSMNRKWPFDWNLYLLIYVLLEVIEQQQFSGQYDHYPDN